jgi:hypothetical protein
MADVVLADAQFTLARVLRPFDAFENIYQGQETGIPIAFPGVLDADAGTPGFSPYLLAGLEVPLGAKVQIWFPVVSYGGELTLNPPTIVPYTYQLHWRMRNVADFRSRRKPYHLGKQTGGAADPTGTPSGQSVERLLLPSCLETVLYQQPEPSDAPAVANLRGTTITVPGDGILSAVTGYGRPLLPVGVPPPPGGGQAFGQYEQGVADPGFMDQATLSIFRAYFTIAKGDELSITVNPIAARVGGTWDFAAEDQGFSNLYGTNVAGPPHPAFPDMGIYVWTGSNPS